MRLRSTMGLVALAAWTAMAQAQPLPATWGRVFDQHGSSLEVPISVVKPRADPFALVFDADGGAVSIRFQTTTESRPGFPGNDPKGDMALTRSDCTEWPPSYYVLKERLAAYSCSKGDKVTYYLARYNNSGSVSLYVEYPRKESGFWDPAVQRMAASIQQVERKEIR